MTGSTGNSGMENARLNLRIWHGKLEGMEGGNQTCGMENWRIQQKGLEGITWNWKIQLRELETEDLEKGSGTYEAS